MHCDFYLIDSDSGPEWTISGSFVPSHCNANEKLKGLTINDGPNGIRKKLFAGQNRFISKENVTKLFCSIFLIIFILDHDLFKIVI